MRSRTRRRRSQANQPEQGLFNEKKGPSKGVAQADTPFFTNVQAQLKDDSVSSPLENEADQIANAMMHQGDAPFFQPQAQLSTPQGEGGQPLASDLRATFEPHLGVDLSKVRLHTNPTAAAKAEQLNAEAFTQGSNIYFNQGEFAPHTPRGRHLLGHELAHVVQQSTTGHKAPAGNLSAAKSGSVQRKIKFQANKERYHLIAETIHKNQWSKQKIKKESERVANEFIPWIKRLIQTGSAASPTFRRTYDALRKHRKTITIRPFIIFSGKGGLARFMRHSLEIHIDYAGIQRENRGIKGTYDELRLVKMIFEELNHALQYLKNPKAYDRIQQKYSQSADRRKLKGSERHDNNPEEIRVEKEKTKVEKEYKQFMKQLPIKVLKLLIRNRRRGLQSLRKRRLRRKPLRKR